jgi:hypothetical protein
MRKTIVRRAVKVGVLATLGAGIALFVSSGARSTIADVYLLVLGGVLLLALFRLARTFDTARRPSPFDRALAQMRAGPPQPHPLELERDIELSRLNVFHYHVRMRPVLREIAAHRLRSRFGVDLEREPARASELVPSLAWVEVRPDCPPPEDRLAPGPSVAKQRAVLDELERL